MFKTGVYTKFEIHIIAPPPFLIYIFTDIYYIEGTPQEKIVCLFLCNFGIF